MSVQTELLLTAEKIAVPIKKKSSYKLILPDWLLHKIKLKNDKRRQWQRTRIPELKSEVNLHRVIQSSKAALKDKKSTGLVTLDIEKAFDRIWLNGLIYKLIGLGYPNHILKITHSFLSERTFRVTLNGCLSSERHIVAGVPQGAVLSPTLFNNFNCDIQLIGSHETALFADDTALFKSATVCSNITSSLKSASIRIDGHFKKWKINVNVNNNIYYDRLNVRTPQPEDDVITVNRSLGLLVEKYKSSIDIFSREMTFMSGDEMENYIQTYGEQHFRGQYGCISHLTFFLNVKVPNLIQVASRPTIASDIFDWHEIVIARIGNLGFIYEPNFNKSFPTRINQIKCKTKIKAIFKKLGIHPGKFNFRLSVGGGGNFNEMNAVQ
ncbi:hypothetical protein PVAND_013315 [Polypedilum vanderplanki]|uniref:Reverse transcriptase domain-containing protein n=1 Tax=Polypedilum vanderplanki TaxID=319348 RepID=A0A9J6CP45_POLVA|nr:hypothetical protein PVAND_013315 [Polypedilum vanderplanki]